MRIAFLSVSDRLGGSETVLLEMLRGLRRHRPSWRTHVVLPGRGPLFARVESAGAECIVVTPPPALARLGESVVADAPVRSDWARFCVRVLAASAVLPGYVRRLRGAIAACNPDILHTNGFKAHVLGLHAAPRASTIWHIHEYVGQRPVTRALLSRYEDRCAAILANSRSVADDFCDAIAPGNPPVVLGNAVDLDQFNPAGPSADLDAMAGLPPPGGPVVRVGLVAAFGRWKGHDVFLRALAMLPPDLPVRAYVVGAPLYETDDSQRKLSELQSLVERSGLAGRVGFTGFAPAPSAMRALDVVVHATTKPEPFGLVIAEAMACGRPVITSAAGGAAELVEPGRDALTHEAGDARSLAAAIERLACDASLRVALGLRARTAAERRFDPDRLAVELVRIYERVGAGRHSPARATGAHAQIDAEEMTRP